MKKEYIVFSQQLAGRLMIQGFGLKRVEKSKKDKDRNIYIFNESENLLKFIQLYKESKETL